MPSENIAPGIELYAADCRDALKLLPDQSVDLVLTDLPYGTTYAPWDSVIPLSALWEQWERVLKPKGAIVLTASQPFTSILVASKMDWFRVEWIWDKEYGANFANAKRQPLKVHESVLVFGPKGTNYYPQMVPGKRNHSIGTAKAQTSELYNIKTRGPEKLDGLKYPKSILKFPRHSSACKWHSTQKPVELFEYLINTYTLPGEVVLDNAAGSGTTGIASVNTKRRAILMENDPIALSALRERFQVEVSSAANAIEVHDHLFHDQPQALQEVPPAEA